MKLFYLLAFACCIWIAQAQECPSTDVTFLLDLSENARRASTELNGGDYGILKDAMKSFLNNTAIDNFRFAIYGYSSEFSQTIAEPGTTRLAALASTDNIGKNFTSAGSWTYKGLQLITVSPSLDNNRLIVVSSVATNDTDHVSAATAEISRVVGLGWVPYVLAVQGALELNIPELTIVNGGQRPVIVREPGSQNAISPKGYRALGGAFADVTKVLCPQRPYGLCDRCLFEGGYGFDFDPNYCDSFYQCFPDAEPIRKLCPAGTFWDGAQCNFINSVSCPVALCDLTTPSGTKYKSGRCCNKYYECKDGSLRERDCADGEVFDPTTSSCIVPASMTAECADMGRHQCDLLSSGVITGRDCNGYVSDPTGDPCYFEFFGFKIRAPAGTIWDQSMCSLTFSNTHFCFNNFLLSRNLLNGTGPAAVCNAVFSSTFVGGGREVFNERLGVTLDVYTIKQEAILANDCLVFTPGMVNPYYYYFFFNNRDLMEDTAFVVRFRLDNPQVGVVYDILSNNYCPLCPETIMFTASMLDGNRISVTVTFVTTTGAIVSTTAVMNNVDANEWLEIRIIFGVATVSGVLRSVNAAGTESQRVDFNTVSKTPGASIAINRCGIQLGRGPNDKFVGSICSFAVHEHCQDINSVLTP